MNKLQRHRATIMSSALVFTFYFAAGSLFPILAILFEEKGYTLSQIMVLLAIPNFMHLVGGPTWAMVSDYFKLHNKAFLLAVFLTIPFVLVLMSAQSYLPTIFIFTLFAFSFSPLMSMVDNSILDFLGAAQNDFGKIRLWGSLSYGLSAWLVGYLTTNFGVSSAYWVFAIAMLLTFLLIKSLGQTSTTQIETEKINFKQGLEQLLKNKYWLPLVIGVFFIGFGQSLIMQYLPRHLQAIGWSGNDVGFSINVSAMSEIPLMLLSAVLLRKLPVKWIFSISAIGLIIRNTILASRIDVAPILFSQALHGITSSLFWVTCVIYVKNIAPNGLQLSALALLAATYYGIAGMASSFGAGSIYDLFGATTMFVSGAIAAGLGLIILFSGTKDFREEVER